MPLPPNRNHKNTAFGGSLVAGQALACWAWLTMLLDEFGVPAEVVVQRQSSEFLRPVKSHFKVETTPVSEKNVARFLLTLSKKGKARLRLKAQVKAEKKICTRYEGDYVAIRRKL